MLFPKLLSAQAETTWFEHWVVTEPGQSTQVQNELLERIATFNDPLYGLYVASSAFNITTEVHDLQIGLYDDMGNALWSSQFNITGGGDVLVGDIVADGSGNVYFTGAVDNGGNSFDALTVKFNSLGSTVWQKTYNGTANGYDGGIDLVLNASGNVYVTGVATETVISRDFLTLGYNSAGTLLWSQLYDGSGLVDVAAKIGLVGSNIMVVGAEQNAATTWNMAAVVYNPTNGTEIGNANLSNNIALNEINGFATDASDNVYIAGARQGSGTGLDALTIKLDSDLNILWEKTYDHSGGDDVANALAVDANGNVSAADQMPK